MLTDNITCEYGIKVVSLQRFLKAYLAIKTDIKNEKTGICNKQRPQAL